MMKIIKNNRSVIISLLVLIALSYDAFAMHVEFEANARSVDSNRSDVAQKVRKKALETKSVDKEQSHVDREINFSRQSGRSSTASNDASSKSSIASLLALPGQKLSQLINFFTSIAWSSPQEIKAAQDGAKSLEKLESASGFFDKEQAAQGFFAAIQNFSSSVKNSIYKFLGISSQPVISSPLTGEIGLNLSAPSTARLGNAPLRANWSNLHQNEDYPTGSYLELAPSTAESSNAGQERAVSPLEKTDLDSKMKEMFEISSRSATPTRGDVIVEQPQLRVEEQRGQAAAIPELLTPELVSSQVAAVEPEPVVTHATGNQGRDIESYYPEFPILEVTSPVISLASRPEQSAVTIAQKLPKTVVQETSKPTFGFGKGVDRNAIVSDGKILSQNIKKVNVPVVQAFHEHYLDESPIIPNRVSKVSFASDAKTYDRAIVSLPKSDKVYEGQEDRNGRQYKRHKYFTDPDLNDLRQSVDMQNEQALETTTKENSRLKLYNTDRLSEWFA